MIMKLYGTEMPEWFIGSAGLIIIISSIISSVAENKKITKQNQ